MHLFSSTRRCLQVPFLALVVSLMLTSSQSLAQPQGKTRAVEHPTFYRTIPIDGLSIFYREAGPKDAPTLLLLHGVKRIRALEPDRILPNRFGIPKSAGF
jgi:hypothetical protein